MYKHTPNSSLNKCYCFLRIVIALIKEVFYSTFIVDTVLMSKCVYFINFFIFFLRFAYLRIGPFTYK